MRETKEQIMSDVRFPESIVESKIIANNTVRYKRNTGNMTIRLHHTDIVGICSDGTIFLNSGGWRTNTTKNRINEVVGKYGITVKQEKGVWKANGHIFYDGMIFDKNGKMLSGKMNVVDTEKIVDELKKKIKKYCNIVDTLDKIPMPDGGDCWHCHLRLGDIEIMTDENFEHLENHMEEGYMFGSIIYNALKEAGYREPGFIMEMNSKPSIKRALRRFLTKRLIDRRKWL